MRWICLQECDLDAIEAAQRREPRNLDRAHALPNPSTCIQRAGDENDLTCTLGSTTERVGVAFDLDVQRKHVTKTGTVVGLQSDSDGAYGPERRPRDIAAVKPEDPTARDRNAFALDARTGVRQAGMKFRVLSDPSGAEKGREEEPDDECHGSRFI